MARIFWVTVQSAAFFGTIWFFSDVAPPEGGATLGAKALFGVVAACIVTAAIHWTFRLLSFCRQKCVDQVRKARSIPNSRVRLPN